jgi:hypothetical protein
VPNPPTTIIAPVVTKPAVPVAPSQPTAPVPLNPAGQSESDSLAALRDIEAMSTLAAAAQQAPEGSAQQRRLTEQAAAGITQAIAEHLNSLIADAAAVNADNASSGDTSVNNAGDGYGADGANAS